MSEQQNESSDASERQLERLVMRFEKMAEIRENQAALKRFAMDDTGEAASNAEREVLVKLRNVVGLAYGHLWLVNNEPGTPHRYTPWRAAYEARKLLRDTMTHEQRGEFINRVIAMRQTLRHNSALDRNEE